MLVSGGLVDEYGPSLALLMATSMKEDFAVPVRWQGINVSEYLGERPQ